MGGRNFSKYLPDEKNPSITAIPKKPGVHLSQDPSGTSRATVLFSYPNYHEMGWPKNTRPIDTSYWLLRGELGLAIINAFFNHFEDQSIRTKLNAVRNLNKLERFFTELDPEIVKKSVADLNHDLGDAYEKWLKTDTHRDVKGRAITGGKKLGYEEKKNRRSFFRSIINQIVRSPSADGAEIPLSIIARNIRDPARRMKSNPSRILTDFELRSILHACKTEIKIIENDFKEMIPRIKMAKKMLPAVYSKNDLLDLPTCLAVIDRDYSGLVPIPDAIEFDNKILAYTIKNVHSRGKLLYYLNPTARILVPFIVALEIRTIFNADPLLSLKQSLCLNGHWLLGQLNSEIIAGEHSNAGREEIARLLDEGASLSTASRKAVASFKGRGRSMQSRSFRSSTKNWDSPPRLITLLKKITARLRRHVDSVERDYLFLSVTRTPKSRFNIAPQIFKGDGGPSSCKRWWVALGNFRRQNNLPDFTLADLRATMTDVVLNMTDGDIDSAQIMLGHKRRETTTRIYETESNRKRNRDKLAAFTNRRVRSINTNGRSRASCTSATPGFNCIDPYSSPISTEVEGRICQAHGRCPMCPHASLSPGPENTAWLLRLQDQYLDAETRMEPARFIEIFEPELAALRDLWFPMIPVSVLESARKFLDFLPPSIPLE